MGGFVKLDAGMRTSSIWMDRDLRSIFITALIMAEPVETTEDTPTINIRDLKAAEFIVPPGWYGLVPAAGIGIIYTDGCELETGLIVLERLAAPDPDSRSQEFDGRRMVRVNGGFLILNYFKYRDRDYTAADRMKRLRERKKNETVTRNGGNVTRNVTQAEDREQSAEDRVQKDRKTTTTLSDTGRDYFDAIWKEYPKRAGGNPRKDALKAYLARRREGVHHADLYVGMRKYAAYIQATGKEGSEYVKLGATFFGPSRHWEEPWDLPAKLPASNGTATARRGKMLAATELAQRLRKVSQPNPYAGGMGLMADWAAEFTETELRVLKAIGTNRILNDENTGTLISQMAKALEEASE